MNVNKKIHKADLFISSEPWTEEEKKNFSEFLKARKKSIRALKSRRKKKSKKQHA